MLTPLHKSGWMADFDIVAAAAEWSGSCGTGGCGVGVSGCGGSCGGCGCGSGFSGVGSGREGAGDVPDDASNSGAPALKCPGCSNRICSQLSKGTARCICSSRLLLSPGRRTSCIGPVSAICFEEFPRV